MWEFDIGKLVVPSVFMDVDLLVSLAKRYDPLTKVVSNFTSHKLFSLSPPMIREF